MKRSEMLKILARRLSNREVEDIRDMALDEMKYVQEAVLERLPQQPWFLETEVRRVLPPEEESLQFEPDYNGLMTTGGVWFAPVAPPAEFCIPNYDRVPNFNFVFTSSEPVGIYEFFSLVEGNRYSPDPENPSTFDGAESEGSTLILETHPDFLDILGNYTIEVLLYASCLFEDMVDESTFKAFSVSVYARASNGSLPDRFLGTVDTYIEDVGGVGGYLNIDYSNEFDQLVFVADTERPVRFMLGGIYRRDALPAPLCTVNYDNLEVNGIVSVGTFETGVRNAFSIVEGNSLAGTTFDAVESENRQIILEIPEEFWDGLDAETGFDIKIVLFAGCYFPEDADPVNKTAGFSVLGFLESNTYEIPPRSLGSFDVFTENLPEYPGNIHNLTITFSPDQFKRLILVADTDRDVRFFLGHFRILLPTPAEECCPDIRDPLAVPPAALPGYAFDRVMVEAVEPGTVTELGYTNILNFLNFGGSSLNTLDRGVFAEKQTGVYLSYVSSDFGISFALGYYDYVSSPSVELSLAPFTGLAGDPSTAFRPDSCCLYLYVDWENIASWQNTLYFSASLQADSGAILGTSAEIVATRAGSESAASGFGELFKLEIPITYPVSPTPGDRISSLNIDASYGAFRILTANFCTAGSKTIKVQDFS